MAHILIVEDEPDLGKLVSEYLQASSHETTNIYNGKEADTWLNENQADLILLDLMLPDMDGLAICKNLRKHSDTPVIMVTAKVEEIDRLLGLELGADDYICKPFSPREVVARVNVVLRRIKSKDTEDNTHEKFNIQLDASTFEVKIGSVSINLTNIEMRLLSMLYNEPGRIFSRQAIMDTIYTDYRIVSDRTVDSHIKKLRKKLSAAAEGTDFIRSIYGAGYKFEINTNTEQS